MKVLVDSSVWIDHLHRPDKQLRELLAADAVCTHPVVIGELACGSIRNRDHFLIQLLRLTSLPEAGAGAALRLIETNGLWGRGLGWGDVQILASCRAHGVPVWTRDATLRRMAAELEILQAIR